ncbi:N-acetylmuramoyl-L-alanine amidase [Cupriavidus sp. KB_39]|jgi:N-acetyl-anhydromuramyl-L-alanine amidase AmpD|uniref:peptidoglycan recognition protein family protein n=1 Tax=Cupriavidus sp. KB_39 TaxID=3233036 RepID=UPI003F8DB563
MLFITKQGHVDAERVRVKIFPKIERGPMDTVNGIVVHQTSAPESSHTFNSYGDVAANGAHFLIDKDGIIYQTASLRRVTNHVGPLRSRCILTKQCSPIELDKISKLGTGALHRHEVKKKWPNRFPSNHDSIGIELVGMAIGPKNKEVYEDVTAAQNSSLDWLISELMDTFAVAAREVYRHPDISYKNLTEARTAKW